MHVEDDVIDTIYKIMKYVYKHSIETYENLHSFGNISIENMSYNEIFCELCWVVYNGGFKLEVIEKYWPFISKEYYYFDINKVAPLIYDEDYEATRICKNSGFNNIKKSKWCIYNANRILELDKEKKSVGGFKTYLSLLSKKDTGVLVNQANSLVEEFNFRGIGNITIFHFLKNIGIDIFKPDIHVCRILSKLGLIENTNASTYEIYKIMDYICSKINTRFFELDTILFEYGKLTNDSLSNL